MPLRLTSRSSQAADDAEATVGAAVGWPGRRKVAVGSGVAVEVGGRRVGVAVGGSGVAVSVGSGVVDGGTVGGAGVLVGAPGGRSVAVATCVGGTGVLVGWAVCVAAGEAVRVGEGDGVRVRVCVAVAVGVAVEPPGRRSVAVGPSVGLRVGVRVGVRVEVGRSVEVACPCASAACGAANGDSAISPASRPNPAMTLMTIRFVRTTGYCSLAPDPARRFEPRYNYRMFAWIANLPARYAEKLMTQRLLALLRPFVWALAAALMIAGSAALAQGTASLTLTDLTLAPGSSGVIEGALSCSPPCGAAALTFAYDPAVLQIDRVRLGGAFGDSSAAEVAALENAIDNGSGRLDLALLAAVPVPQPTDDLLFTLDVTALGAGQTVLEPSRQDFSDLRGAPLNGEVTGGSVTVAEGAAPATQEAVEPTATPSEPAIEPTPAATSGEACTVSSVVAGVPIHVGPDRNRAIRGSLPTGEDVAVTGQFTDTAGRVWWRVQPDGVTTELDRYWVLESDVDERGDCTNVPQTEGSAVISGGAGFNHTFTGGQRSFAHTVALPAGNWSVTCSGVPVYPEFQVGGQRSNGQTSINGTGGGSQTLTVFSTVVNRQGQVTAITSYSCALARR